MLKRVSIGDGELQVADQGHGETILYVHGFPLDHSMWQPQLDAAADYSRGIAPDLRGFGGSSAVPDRWTMAQYADDLARLIDKLKIDGPITFCGLSMGGYIGWQFVQRHRQRVKRLIQCDTRAAADSPEAAAHRRKLADEVILDGSEKLVQSMTPKLFRAEVLEPPTQIVIQTQQVMRRTAPQAIAAALRGMAERPDVSPALANIDVPTLILCGTHDAISPPDEMRGIAESIPGAQFVEIPQAGHMSPLENPQAAQEAIRAFLRSA